MIHPCDKPCGNKTASGYCATTACINPQYSNLGTAQYGQGVQKHIFTNADKLRAMTDEELAYFIAEPSVAPPPWCKEIPVCPHLDEDIVPCHECALDWLKKEADNGN